MLTETKLFYFHRICKNGGGEGGSSDPPELTPDPSLHNGCFCSHPVIYTTLDGMTVFSDKFHKAS